MIEHREREKTPFPRPDLVHIRNVRTEAALCGAPAGEGKSVRNLMLLHDKPAPKHCPGCKRAWQDRRAGGHFTNRKNPC